MFVLTCGAKCDTLKVSKYECRDGKVWNYMVKIWLKR